MNTIVVTAPDPSGAVTADEPAVTGEAAVDIAEIQAERDVEIAEIQAETTALTLETQQDEDETWLRDELAALHGSHAALAENLSRVEQSQQAQAELIQELAAQLTLLTASSIPSPPLEEAPPEPMNPPEPAVEPAGGGEDPPAPRRPHRQLRWL